MNQQRILCAKKAITLIRQNMTVGLGGGRNIKQLIETLGNHKELVESLTFVSSSDSTIELLFQKGYTIQSLGYVDHVHITFDGCGEITEDFIASKAGGGIHTREKLLAAMSDEYIILGDSGKWKKELSSDYPVSLEVMKVAQTHVIKSLNKMGGKPTIRRSERKDGYVITDDGNILIDVTFNEFGDVHQLQQALLQIVGVVETSFFTKEVTGAIITDRQNVILKTKQQ